MQFKLSSKTKLKSFFEIFSKGVVPLKMHVEWKKGVQKTLILALEVFNCAILVCTLLYKRNYRVIFDVHAHQLYQKLFYS